MVYRNHMRGGGTGQRGLACQREMSMMRFAAPKSHRGAQHAGARQTHISSAPREAETCSQNPPECYLLFACSVSCVSRGPAAARRVHAAGCAGVPQRVPGTIGAGRRRCCRWEQEAEALPEPPRYA